MSSACVRIFVPLLVAARLLAATHAAATLYDDGRGKLWRQPADTVGYSWNQVRAMAGPDGTTGQAGPLAGWKWATQQQVIDLFNLFLPPTHQLTVQNPGMEAYLQTPFRYTTTFAMNGAPYSFFNAIRGWTSTLTDDGRGIRGTISDGGNSVSFSASVGVNDPWDVTLRPGYLNETGIWLWKPSADPAADFDRDDVVGPGDLTMWLHDYGVSATADANFDGRTDGRDFLEWQQQLGDQASSAVVAAPEPTSTALAMAAAAFLAYQSRTRRGTSG